MEASITFAIGDIHGCFEKLKSLLAACDAFRGRQSAQFIFIGDYIDRGPQSKDVIDFLIKGGGERNRDFVCLRGNHEEMLLRAADKNRSDLDLMTWLGNGGEATLESYGVDDPSDLPAEHLAWMRGLPLHTSDPHHLFVHAGIRPGIALASQSAEDLLWIREPFLSSGDNHGVFVVHGHTPTPARKPPSSNFVGFDIATGRRIKLTHDRQRKVSDITVAVVEGEAGKTSRNFAV